MLDVVLVVIIIFLISKVIVLRSSLGGLVMYLAENNYPIPTQEEIAEWGKQYIRTYFDNDTGD